jgi:hypothetical protein
MNEIGCTMCGFFHMPALAKKHDFMQMHFDAKKSLNRKRELGIGSIDPILFVKAYLDTMLSETACAPNKIILKEDCGPRYWVCKFRF